MVINMASAADINFITQLTKKLGEWAEQVHEDYDEISYGEMEARAELLANDIVKEVREHDRK